MKRTKAFILSLMLGACVPVQAVPAESFARVVAGQCQSMDKSVRKELRFKRGRTTAFVRDRITLCTSHDYYLRARRGQRMSVHLVAGKKTSFAVYAPTDRLSDGTWDWSGELPEDGEYQISIGTDITARYTLEVTIR